MRASRQRLLIALLLATALAVTWLRPLDTRAERSVEAGLKRALIAFASARTLNAALSALQEATVSFQVGAGISVKPGAILKPLDEVVGHFSNLMFVATASFAVQLLMIEIFSAWPVSALLSVLLLAWAGFAMRARGPPRWLTKLAVAMLIMRLAVPVFALASEAADWAVLDRQYQKHMAQLTPIESTEPKAATGDGVLDKLKSLYAQGGDIVKQIETLRSRAQDIVENLVRLAAVFVVQTLVLPLLFVGVLFWLYRALTRWPHP